MSKHESEHAQEIHLLPQYQPEKVKRFVCQKLSHGGTQIIAIHGDERNCKTCFQNQKDTKVLGMMPQPMLIVL